MSDSKKAFPLRVSERLFEQLRKWANEDMRSVNGQIEFLLNEAVKKRDAAQSQSGSQTLEPQTEPEQKSRRQGKRS